jgi:beta-glucosidase
VLRKIHLAPYREAIKAGVGSVMASYSSWNGVKMHANRHLLTDVLKGELGFKGFVVSDWAAIDQLQRDYKACIEASINAGLDMVMVPNGPGKANNYVEFITKLTELIHEGRVPMSRIDDAVRRILRVKFEMGAFEERPLDPALTAAIGSDAHRAVARECVRQSLVLLKNEGQALPLSTNLKRVCVVGKGTDDLGMQCGGWTISWQGAVGKVTPGGTTILEGIRQAVNPNCVVAFSPDGSALEAADVIIAVVGEKPYAEMKGDRAQLHLAAEDVALIRKAKQTGARVVTILLSGRPLILGEALEASDSFVAAWLPGTEGQGVADVLFGVCKARGKLPRAWPGEGQGTSSGVVFRSGFGLAYK